MNQKQQLGPFSPASYGLRIGTVIATYPHLGLYSVLDHHGSYVTCIVASAGHSILGTENVSVFSVGNQVAFFYVDELKLGVIIGSISERVVFPNIYRQEELVPGSFAGYLAEPLSKEIEETFKQFQTLRRFRGSYLDALPGDITHISRTGAAVFSSPLLVGLKVNEFCGVWANYLDSLLRVAGWNFQEWTSGYEKAVHTYWNLIWEYEGHGATIFEQLGYRRAFEPKSYSFWKTQRELGRYKERIGPLEIDYEQGEIIEIPGDTLEKQEREEEEIPEDENFPEIAVRGSLEKYRLPFHTRQKWGGILAPGGVEFLFAQPDSIEGYRTEQGEGEGIKAEEAVYPRPLVQQGTTHTGIWYVKSVNGILLCKFPWVSAPIRTVDIDERAGSVTYKKIKQAERYLYRRPLNNKGKRFTTIRCTSLFDIQNFITNWEAKLGFYVFSDKFEFLTEQKQAGINFNQYRGERPALKRQRRSAAFIMMDPYGDIILENGAGASIEMIGDTIRISAPGGIKIDGGYEIKMFSNHIIQLAEREHNTICGKQYGVFVVRKPNPGEPNRRILTGLRIWVDKSNRGRVLIPRDAIAHIYRLNSMEVIANDVVSLANSDLSGRLKEADFSLIGDDLNPIATATYPVQRWSWFYKQRVGADFEVSELVAPERFSVEPSTFQLENASKEPEASSDDTGLLQQEFKDVFEDKPVYPLLVKKVGSNDYSI